VRGAVFGVLAALLLVALCGAASAASVSISVHFVGDGKVIESASFVRDGSIAMFARSTTVGSGMDYKLSEWIDVGHMSLFKTISIDAREAEFDGSIGVSGKQIDTHAVTTNGYIKYSAYGNYNTGECYSTIDVDGGYYEVSEHEWGPTAGSYTTIKVGFSPLTWIMMWT